jgi:polar amino acid transport system substrate-binding protein
VARAIAKHLGVPVKITGVAGPAGVLDSLKKSEADIGLLAFDPARAKEVDFSAPYALAQNTYLVPVDSAIKSVADIDKPGIRVGVTERDAGELYLSRVLKAAEIKRNTTGNLDVVTKWLAGHEVDAYGTNRQRLTELAARNPGYRLRPTISTASSSRSSLPRATRPCSTRSTRSSTRRAAAGSSLRRSHAQG